MLTYLVLSFFAFGGGFGISERNLGCEIEEISSNSEALQLVPKGSLIIFSVAELAPLNVSVLIKIKNIVVFKLVPC